MLALSAQLGCVAPLRVGGGVGSVCTACCLPCLSSFVVSMRLASSLYVRWVSSPVLRGFLCPFSVSLRSPVLAPGVDCGGRVGGRFPSAVSAVSRRVRVASFEGGGALVLSAGSLEWWRVCAEEKNRLCVGQVRRCRCFV